MKLLPLLLLAALPAQGQDIRRVYEQPADGATAIAVAEAGFDAWVAGRAGEDDSRLIVTRSDGSAFAELPLMNEGGTPPTVERIEQATACEKPVIVISTSTMLGRENPSFLLQRHLFAEDGAPIGSADDEQSQLAGGLLPARLSSAVTQAAGC